jgi:hypothetical protein
MSAWIDKMFKAKIVKRDGVVRRKRSTVEKCASYEELLSTVKKKRYHLIETGEQYVVMCNAGKFKVHC